jgi:hypothetical protein
MVGFRRTKSNLIVMTSARLLDGALRCALIATVFFCATLVPPFLARETICNWIYRLSGIPDRQGRFALREEPVLDRS